ncbi:MAG: metal ABC transporter permease [Spirochaetota bacterium]|nr:metal ABC transporter permease [Spirochaetota bacterium]
MIDILIPAFLISLILLGIHSYFGIRIIQRNIIFTDLAIGQMAALGAAISLLLFHGEYVYLLSLFFSIATGLLISFISKRSQYLEAVIGLLYALGLSGVFILLSKSAHGMEEFQNLMAYDILFTNINDVYKTAVIYACLGGFIYLFERKTSGNLKNLLFFLTFAVTVTSSVRMAGVLVVFAILLAPAFIAVQISTLNRMPAVIHNYTLITAWIIGIVLNIIAITISFYGDFPTGYTIVFVNAFTAVTASFIKQK